MHDPLFYSFLSLFFSIDLSEDVFLSGLTWDYLLFWIYSWFNSIWFGATATPTTTVTAVYFTHAHSWTWTGTWTTRMGVKKFFQTRSGFRVDNSKTTSAATLTLRQSLYPLGLVTILFFLWVCLPCFSTLSISGTLKYIYAGIIRVLRMDYLILWINIFRILCISRVVGLLDFKRLILGKSYLSLNSLAFSCILHIRSMLCFGSFWSITYTLNHDWINQYSLEIKWA